MTRKNENVDEVARLKAMLEEANSERERLRQQMQSGVFCNVSQKGCVTLNGIRRRFGVSFYANEWEAILSHKDMILNFINDHRDELPAKPKPGPKGKSKDDEFEAIIRAMKAIG